MGLTITSDYVYILIGLTIILCLVILCALCLYNKRCRCCKIVDKAKRMKTYKPRRSNLLHMEQYEQEDLENEEPHYYYMDELPINHCSNRESLPETCASIELCDLNQVFNRSKDIIPRNNFCMYHSNRNWPKVMHQNSNKQEPLYYNWPLSIKCGSVVDCDFDPKVGEESFYYNWPLRNESDTESALCQPPEHRCNFSTKHFVGKLKNIEETFSPATYHQNFIAPLEAVRCVTHKQTKKHYSDTESIHILQNTLSNNHAEKKSSSAPKGTSLKEGTNYSHFNLQLRQNQSIKIPESFPNYNFGVDFGTSALQASSVFTIYGDVSLSNEPRSRKPLILHSLAETSQCSKSNTQQLANEPRSRKPLILHSMTETNQR